MRGSALILLGMSQPESSVPGRFEVDAALRGEIEQLNRAIETRSVIGQAQGIVMARLDVDAEHALSFLKRLSSTSNRKLVDIATEIATTRRLPTGR